MLHDVVDARLRLVRLDERPEINHEVCLHRLCPGLVGHQGMLFGNDLSDGLQVHAVESVQDSQ